MSNKLILELDLGKDFINLPNPQNENLKVNIFGKELTLKVINMEKNLSSVDSPVHYGGITFPFKVIVLSESVLKIVAFAEDTKAKELAEARKEVNDTKEAHKRAQQKLSKLLEG